MVWIERIKDIAAGFVQLQDSGGCMKRLLLIFLVLGVVFAVSGCFSKKEKEKESSAIETPVQAAEAFYQAVKDNDMDAINSLLAASDMAESVDVSEMLERNRYYDISGTLVQPVNETAITLNRKRLEGAFYLQLQYFYFGFFINDIFTSDEKEIFERPNIALFDNSDMAEKIVELMEEVDYDSLKTLELYDVIETNSLMDENGGRGNSFRLLREIFGAEDFTRVIVIYQLDDNYYGGGLGLIQYTDGWKIYDLRCYELDDFLGMVTPMSKSQLDEWYETIR